MSMGTSHVLIFGTSVRAAAFSALRAGLSPWCADLFADADLRRRCPSVRLAGRYPMEFLELVDRDLLGPWMYTGGLENHPVLVGDMQIRRRLWGNGPSALMRARDPEVLAGASRAAGFCGPALAVSGRIGSSGAWLQKPRAGAGGSGIRHAQAGEPIAAGWYAQEFVSGTPAAALFVAIGGRSVFLGLTRQLVGEDWLNAPAFRYCGSIGVLDPSPALAGRLRHLGALLVHRAGLLGLFGVDGLLDGDIFRPVEVNPRYTASVEVVELSTGVQALDLHRRAFEDVPPTLPPATRRVVGKAIVYAPTQTEFPEVGPWLDGGDESPLDVPEYGDIPAPGETVLAGHPILTVFASAPTPEACERQLRERAADVSARLFPDLVRGRS